MKPVDKEKELKPFETVVRLLTQKEAEDKGFSVTGAYGGKLGIFIGTENSHIIKIGVPIHRSHDDEWRIVCVKTTRDRISDDVDQESSEAMGCLQKFREVNQKHGINT